jgi:ABC-type transport system substrate-binding protein
MLGKKLADRYEITAELGRGGMGVVYRARDPVLNREVALKLIPPSQLSPDSEHRFQREAQLVAQMDHPAIVSIYDFGSHEGSLFFVMPLVQGTNLRAFLREDSVLGEVLDIGIQIAEALEYSHARGVVHRDIKPENIMVSREEGSGVRVRVMDFGLARAANESRLTKTGTLVGTLCYLSPEQVMAKETDGRSDIYALGTVLYECVVGEAPFSGEAQSVLYRIVHEFPQAPRSFGAAIDEDFEQVILACLAKEPAKRPQRASEVADSLKRYRSRLHESDRARSIVGFTRTFSTQRPALAPFVGRAKEFGELQQRLNAAVAGECQFAVLAGEPGIGKTRLLDELENLARARKIRVLHGRSVEQAGAFPYQGFCEIIQEHFRVKDTASAPAIDFSDLAADLLALFPMLNEVSEIRSAATGDSKLLGRGGAAGPENRTQIFELLARTLTRLAGGRPAVLSLEDLHEAEVTIEALQYIVRRLGPTPTLIVGTYRSTEVDSRHPLTRMIDGFRGDRRFVSMTLGPFSASEHRSFLETLVGGGAITDGLAQRLYQGSEGNPFFTKELVRSLMDSGGMGRDPTGAWNLSAEAGISADVLPATIQQAVEKRIERLPEELREILSVASLIGKSFDSRELELMTEGKGDLEDALDQLLREGLIEEERSSRGDILTFSSGVVRDVLYAGLSRRKRRALHRRYAELIETRHAGRRERILPQLVHHFYQGDVPEKTVEYGLQLARASLDAFSAEEATRAAKTALEFLDEEWEGDRSLEGEARTLLARAHRMAGDIDGALREAAAAARVFEQQNQPARAVGPLVLAAETAWHARRTEQTGRFVTKGLDFARSAGDIEALRQLLSLAATLANLLGEYETANQCLEEAARLGSDAGEAEGEAKLPPGGTLVVAMANPVEAIEPTRIRTDDQLEVATNVYETLLATDVRGTLVPSICEKWEAADQGRTFRLTLRRGVRFSDGTPLTAGDVKLSFETSIRVAGQLPAAFAALGGAEEYRAGRAEEVGGVVVKGDHEIEIHLLEPLPIYPALLTQGSTGVVRPLSEGGRDRLIGTGPFRLASLDPERVVLERSPNYWKAASPPLDAIEFRTGLSATAIARGFRSGAIDVARDLLPEDLEEMLKDPRLRGGLVEAAKKNVYFILFNAASGPLARHAALRRALAGLVRPQDIVWRTLGSFAEPASGLIPPGTLGHDAGRRARSLTREEARELLQSTGIAGGIRLKAAVHPLLRDRYGALLSALFSLWAELGVEVEVATSDMSAYLESWKRSEGIDLLIGRWNADYDDPDNMTHTLFHSRTGLLGIYFSSAEADQVLEEARSEGRPAVREGLYRKFENLLFESSVVVPLFHDIDYRLASPKVRGLRLRGTAPYVNYSELAKVESAEPAPETARGGGGAVQVPIAGVVTGIDPARSDALEQGEVIPCVFETLTRDIGGRVVPWLAADFVAEESGRRYRFRLRDDVRFHDGRRLTARDVRYSFERMLQARESESRWFYSLMRGAKTVLNEQAKDLAGFRVHSAAEFSIELEEPVAFFPALLSNSVAAIVPEGSDPWGGGGAPDWVGTGPFRVVSFEPGRRLELERNKSYWRRGYPRSEGLVFTFGVSPQDSLSGFRDGRFSLVSDLFPADVEALRREPEFAAGYLETPRLITYYAAFNTRRGPLSDRSLRQRLVQAVDVPRLVRQTLGRLAIPALGLIPPGLLGHERACVARPDSPSSPPEKPSAALDLTAAVHPMFFGGYAALGRELSTAFAEKGVKVRPVTETMAELAKAVTQASVDLTVGRWAADYPDADTFIYLLHSQEGFLGRFSGSAEIDRLAERGRAETSPAVRHSLYRQVEEILAREALLLPLFHEQAYRFARPELEGLTLSFGTPTVAYENLRIRG